MPDRPSAKTKAPARPRNIGPKGRGLRDDIQEFKRDLILKTATDIFFEQGFHSTTVDEIAAAMSMSKAVVYWNFTSKKDLLEEIVERALTKLSRCISYIRDDRTPAENLAEVCFRHSATVLTNQKEVAVYLYERRHRSASLKRKVKSQQDLVVTALAKLLEAGVRAGEFNVRDHELVAYDILNMISMLFDWRWHHDVQRLSPGNLSLHFAEQALRLAGYVGEFPFSEGELVIDAPSVSRIG